jgi:hypothetical protein
MPPHEVSSGRFGWEAVISFERIRGKGRGAVRSARLGKEAAWVQGGCGGMENERRQPEGVCRRLYAGV